MKKFYLHIENDGSLEQEIVVIHAMTLDLAAEHADRIYGKRCVRIRPHVDHSVSR